MWNLRPIRILILLLLTFGMFFPYFFGGLYFVFWLAIDHLWLSAVCGILWSAFVVALAAFTLVLSQDINSRIRANEN